MSDYSTNAQDGGHEIIIGEDAYGIEMVYVPAGVFEFGVSEEELNNICFAYEEFYEHDINCNKVNKELSSGIQQNMTMLDFWIDRYEVDNASYQLCVDDGECEPIYLVEHYQDRDNNDPQKPIVGATWFQASHFCGWREARLPTEIEWEYAASGPDNLSLPWGGYIAEEFLSFWDGSLIGGTNEFDVSWVGAYDMAHNVQEWVEDRYVPFVNFEDEHIRRYEADFYRVVRGGGWTTIHTDSFTFERSGLSPTYASYGIGFRCARFSNPS